MMHIMGKSSPEKYAWQFRARFRAKAYGWKSSKLAAQRLKEAVKEIAQVARHDPVVAAEGAILLIQRLSPAFDQVDDSWGALQTAIYHTLEALVPLIAEAPADRKLRSKWLEKLWEAFQNDQMPWIEGLGDRWGELCGSPELANQWADILVQPLRIMRREKERSGYYQGSCAALSSLLHADRYEELLDFLEWDRLRLWSHRRYGVEALAAMGRIDDAIDYARASAGLNDPVHERASVCERILLAAGRSEDAYREFALPANTSSTYLATFRNIAKKYPSIEPARILGDLIRSTPGEEGKWFATAKDLGFYDLAAELARRSPTAPQTLVRAARDFNESQPRFAMEVALAALNWMIAGYGFDLTASDVFTAYRLALAAAGKLDETAETIQRIQGLLRHDQIDWVSKILKPELAVAAAAGSPHAL